MSDFQGFWSYVYDDDQDKGERISRLAKDVAGQFALLTGEIIKLLHLEYCIELWPRKRAAPHRS